MGKLPPRLLGVGMSWFRKHIAFGSRFALLALTLQLLLSFGYIHGLSAPGRSASVLPGPWTAAGRSDIAAAADSQHKQAPSKPDRDHQADLCSVCILLS